MRNKVLQAAVDRYIAVGANYIHALENMGIEFAPAGSSDDAISGLRNELESRGALMRNAGASISVGWLSDACVECTGSGGSETFSTTFACHRDCYFCFNHNVAGYEDFVANGCPWEQGLEDSLAANGTLACVGLTGGEPLLVFDDTIRFLEKASQMFPDAHLRMYTSGDLLDEQMASRLGRAGLREIRFSVKNDDARDMQERVLENMEMATRFIPDVVVEMPIVPGCGDQLRQLMSRFAKAGIKGMNLLEFCFPFHNWEEYSKRGFIVRNPPFDVMYDYGYSGGLPIAGSEELALELMLYAMDEHLGFGLHYCSLDNKHRSEMRQRNEPGAHIHPSYEFDRGDFFLKTIKVYGEDVAPAAEILQSAGCRGIVEDESGQSISFNPRFLEIVKSLDVEPAVSFNILETSGGDRFLREVNVVPIGQPS